ncbi:MAG TPA: family 1 glycosylhydrolase, partial [Candidatus Andersenbacteria bacterium]|nr:family 1 glycosylhydrolase [Candidatus Andersenbacteria bacterium]
MAVQFLWGAATSAHQAEGNNVHSDWWAWERKTPGIESSGRATDHWHMFRDDFALARQLGHTAHRLSIEWARIEPKRGVWNRPALEHYREVLRELKRQGLVSFVTLHHFTNPQWFAARGGWERADAPELF